MKRIGTWSPFVHNIKPHLERLFHRLLISFYSEIAQLGRLRK